MTLARNFQFLRGMAVQQTAWRPQPPQKNQKRAGQQEELRVRPKAPAAPAPGRLREGRDQPGGTAAAFAGACRLAVLAAAWLHCGIISYDSAGRPLLPGSWRFLPAAARWPPPVGRTCARPT